MITNIKLGYFQTGSWGIPRSSFQPSSFHSPFSLIPSPSYNISINSIFVILINFLFGILPGAVISSRQMKYYLCPLT